MKHGVFITDILDPGGLSGSSSSGYGSGSGRIASDRKQAITYLLVSPPPCVFSTLMSKTRSPVSGRYSTMA